MRHHLKHDRMFFLHPRLAADTFPVGDLKLCRVLLMNDVRFPWLILVPRKTGVRELFELSSKERSQLIDEVSQAERTLTNIVPWDKLNVGALGNVVPQLHIHVLARRVNDAAWPRPVWGCGKAEPYDKTAAKSMVAILRSSLAVGYA